MTFWNTAGPVSVGNGLIEGNYLHGLTQCGSEHNDGIGVNAGSTSLVIDHNTVLDPLNQTCAICLFSDFGQVRNVTIKDNLLAGGAYTLYGGLSGNQGASSTPAVTITGNKFLGDVLPERGNLRPRCPCLGRGRLVREHLGRRPARRTGHRPLIRMKKPGRRAASPAGSFIFPGRLNWATQNEPVHPQ